MTNWERYRDEQIGKILRLLNVDSLTSYKAKVLSEALDAARKWVLMNEAQDYTDSQAWELFGKDLATPAPTAITEKEFCEQMIKLDKEYIEKDFSIRVAAPERGEV